MVKGIIKTKKEHQYIEVRQSSIHNTGVYAKIDIPKDTKIIEYVGEKITKEESEKRGDELMKKGDNNKNAQVFIFEIDKHYDIDGNVSYNPARFINHSCDPNAEAVNENKRIWIISKRFIKKGEEITYDYGYSMEDFEEHPCLCGSEKCVGYIVSEEYRPRVRKILKRRQKNKNRQYGK